MDCSNNTWLDYLLMLIQLLFAGLVLLIVIEFFRRGVKKLGEWIWAGVLRVVFPKGAQQ